MLNGRGMFLGVMCVLNRGLAKNILGRAAEAKQDFLTALSFVENEGDEGLKAKILSKLQKGKE